MQKALKRIYELQNDIIAKSKTINGADEYVQERMRLYQENEQARKRMKEIQIEEQIITERFLSTHK